MPRLFPPHRKAGPAATCSGAQKHTIVYLRVSKHNFFTSGLANTSPETLKPWSVIVRARHVVATDFADQLAAPRLQPLRADGTKPRSIFITRHLTCHPCGNRFKI